MLPKYRRLVERLAQAGLLKVICGTDTLGVGINVPIRTVRVHRAEQVRRHPHPPPQRPGVPPDRRASRPGRLRHRGRRRRAGPRTRGARTPRPSPRPATIPEKRRKVVRKKPARGIRCPGASRTFDRLVAAEPEPLTSSFAVSHAMLLNVSPTARRRVRGDAPPAHRQPRGPSRAAPAHPPGHRDLPCAARRWRGRAVGGPGRRRPHRAAHRGPAARLRAEPAAVPVRAGRDRAARPESVDYPLDVLSVLEATLDDPRQVLRRTAVQGQGRGRGGDESRGHRVRGADAAARRRQLPDAAGRAARRRIRDLPGRSPVGAPTTGCRPSRSPGISPSGR